DGRGGVWTLDGGQALRAVEAGLEALPDGVLVPRRPVAEGGVERTVDTDPDGVRRPGDHRRADQRRGHRGAPAHAASARPARNCKLSEQRASSFGWRRPGSTASLRGQLAVQRRPQEETNAHTRLREGARVQGVADTLRCQAWPRSPESSTRACAKPP